jgi:bacteriocin-like protein
MSTSTVMQRELTAKELDAVSGGRSRWHQDQNKLNQETQSFLSESNNAQAFLSMMAGTYKTLIQEIRP